MKFDFNGIRFNTWMYFFTFSLTILALLGFLLLSMIKPYYRDSQLKTIDAISHTIETRLIDSKADEKAVEEMSRLVIDSIMSRADRFIRRIRLVKYASFRIN